MAEKVIRQLIDDIDGSDAARTRHFSVDGKNYKIDLSEKNNEKFDKALALFIEHAATESPMRAAARTSSSAPRRDFDISALREWAAKHKIEVPSRGRIPGAVVDQYRASLRK